MGRGQNGAQWHWSGKSGRCQLPACQLCGQGRVWGVPVWGWAGEGLYLAVRPEGRTGPSRVEDGRQPRGLCSCVGLTPHPQSRHRPLLSCQIPTPTQEKGSTFCQMLRPLPLQKAPASLSLCRMRGPTPAAGRRPSRARSGLGGRRPSGPRGVFSDPDLAP